MATRKERLGIYGGAFSPIHSGHVRSAHLFLEKMELDKVLIVPTAVPPHKPMIADATVEQRLEMARLAFGDSTAYKGGRIEVSDFEAVNKEKSYTVLTLEHFAASDRELFLLVGTDMFFTLGKWYRSDDIFSLAEIVLIRRETDEINTPAIEQKKAEYTEKFGARIHEICETPIVISSTELRSSLKANGETDDYIPMRVARYIKENGLYRKNDNDN